MPGRDAIASSKQKLLASISAHPQSADARWSQFRQSVADARSADQVAALDTPALAPGGVRAHLGALAGVKTGLFATQERNNIDRALRAYKTAVADRELQRSHLTRVRSAAAQADRAAERKRNEDEAIRRAQEAYAASAEGKAAKATSERIRRAVDANQERRRRAAAAESSRQKVLAMQERFGMSDAQWEELSGEEQAGLTQEYDAERDKDEDKKQGMTGIMGNIGGKQTKRRRKRHRGTKRRKSNRRTRRGKKHQRKGTRRRR